MELKVTSRELCCNKGHGDASVKLSQLVSVCAARAGIQCEVLQEADTLENTVDMSCCAETPSYPPSRYTHVDLYYNSMAFFCKDTTNKKDFREKTNKKKPPLRQHLHILLYHMFLYFI